MQTLPLAPTGGLNYRAFTFFVIATDVVSNTSLFFYQLRQFRRASKAHAHHMSEEEKKKRKKSAKKVEIT